MSFQHALEAGPRALTLEHTHAHDARALIDAPLKTPMGCGPSKNKRDVVDESDDLVVLLLPDGSSCSVSQAEADDARARLEEMMARLEFAESALEAMEVAAETVAVDVVDGPTEEAPPATAPASWTESVFGSWLGT